MSSALCKNYNLKKVIQIYGIYLIVNIKLKQYIWYLWQFKICKYLTCGIYEACWKYLFLLAQYKMARYLLYEYSILETLAIRKVRVHNFC